MKCVLLSVCALMCIYSVFCDEKYSSKFENIDLDEILHNDRLLNAYYKCLMDQGTCTPEGEELKKVLPEAVQTGCEKCTDAQKRGAKKVYAFLSKEKKEMWETLMNKYDPDRIYREKYKDLLSSK
ncbi:hypothetical protein HHI36_003586 [Cryptolaemus montrouzieri]|uniref:Chemosensory protein n=1 Tax=Cryptolaemus montrouzieri TaxID=559131 RepID=A0ABD2PEG0_9CUCU